MKTSSKEVTIVRDSVAYAMQGNPDNPLHFRIPFTSIRGKVKRIKKSIRQIEFKGFAKFLSNQFTR